VFDWHVTNLVSNHGNNNFLSFRAIAAQPAIQIKDETFEAAAYRNFRLEELTIHPLVVGAHYDREKYTTPMI